MLKNLGRWIAGRVLVLTLVSAPLFAELQKFTFDRNHSLVGFRIRHFVTRVEGRFRDFEGAIWIDREKPSASRVEPTIQAASIDTGVENRDKHLRSADFFDAEKYPTITFKSTTIEPKGNDAYSVTGNFTMHGVTRPMIVPVRHGGFVNLGKVEKAGFEATFLINRKDFGVTWNRSVDQGGVMLGDEVEINLQVEADRELPEASRPAAPPAAAFPSGALTG